MTQTKVQRVQLSSIDPPDWKELSSKLWEEKWISDRFSSGYHHYHQPEKVRLSQEGWDQIKRLITDRNICVEVFNSCSGFSCSLTLWKDREEPFPGAEIDPQPLITICSHMLPGDERCGFKEGWAEFEPLFTRPKNLELLKWNKRPMPKRASHYDY